MAAKDWLRTSRQLHCPICSKPDWCLVSKDGRSAICMRIESSCLSLKCGGWLHTTDKGLTKSVRFRYIPRDPPDPPDFDAMLNKWRGLGVDHVQWFAAQLGLRQKSLVMLGACAWPSTLAIPMYDENGGTIGIRLRNKAGYKYAVKGSHQGLFIPYGAFGKFPLNPCLICEGPTDTAAALEAGYFALGRPSALGQEKMLRKCLANLGIKKIVYCGDQDEAGQRGEHKLIALFPIPAQRLHFPAKDLRAWLSKSRDKHEVLAFAIRQLN